MKNSDLHLSWFSSLTNTTAQRLRWGWEDAIRELTVNPKVVPVKDAAPLYSPALYNGTPRRAAVNVVAISAVVLDFDNSQGSGAAATCLDAPTYPEDAVDNLGDAAYLWHTTWSHSEEWPKWRLIIPLAFPVSPRDYPAVFAGALALLGNDPAIDRTSKDVSRAYYVYSCPPGTNPRSGFQDGPFIDPNYLLDLVGLPPILPAESNPSHAEPVKNKNPTSPLTGGRNNALKAIAAAMLERGEEIGAILAELIRHDMSHHSPPLFGDPEEPQYAGLPPEMCALKFFTSVALSINQNRLAAGLEPEAPRIGATVEPDATLFTSAAVLAARQVTIDWVIKKRVEANTTGYTFGPSGGGKTFETLHRWLCVATGLPWMGQPVKQGLVLYCCGEGHAGITRRVKAWLRHHGMDPEHVALFHVSNKTLDMQGGLAQIIAEGQALQEHYGLPLVGIIVDTVARHMHGDENSTKDMNEFIRCLDTLRQAFPGSVAEGVHHSGHQQGRARGSTAFKGAADFEFEISDNLIRCHKMKDAEQLPDREFKLVAVPTGDLDEDGEDLTSCIVEYGDEVKVAPKSSLKPSEQRAVKFLVELSASQMVPDDMGRFGAYIGDWRQRWLDDEGKSGAAGKQAWYRVLKVLREQHLVTDDDRTAHLLMDRHQDDINTTIMSNNIMKKHR